MPGLMGSNGLTTTGRRSRGRVLARINGQRDIDWGATVARDMFDVGGRVTVGWVREIPVEAWMTDQASHSYIAGLGDPERTRLLAELRRIVQSEVADGTMVVPYKTWLWIATRR